MCPGRWGPAQRVGELGGQHPVVAVVPDGAAHDFLGAALLVDVGGVDEVDAPALARAMISWEVGSSVGPPNIMVPNARRETFRPLRPR